MEKLVCFKHSQNALFSICLSLCGSLLKPVNKKIGCIPQDTSPPPFTLLYITATTLPKRFRSSNSINKA
nr:hypothetical protein Itr_chr01CG15000 [Ipomoea trifida]GMC49775.1 hypothetical protein Iba_chr01bCG10800 [Ipomoea batatas]GMC53377.1 hypothetical protein Iba_chr01dCG6030 [Ipomoea batatas]